MKIDKAKLKMGIWYEDQEGNRIPDSAEEIWNHPANAATYHVQWPLEIREEIRGIYTNKDTCKHPFKCRKRLKECADYAIKCAACGKIKYSKNRLQSIFAKWSTGPDSYDCVSFQTHIGRGNEEIILAMANSGDYTLGEAIIVFATACERCMNVLSYKYTNGKEGYKEFSDEWKKCGTVCDFCRHEGYQRRSSANAESEDKE